MIEKQSEIIQLQSGIIDTQAQASYMHWQTQT